MSHETEQLQRPGVEDARADLREKWQDLARRVEDLERRTPPAA